MTKKAKLELAESLLLLRTASIEHSWSKIEVTKVSMVNVKMFACMTIASHIRALFDVSDLKSQRIASIIIYDARIARHLTSTARDIASRAHSREDRNYEFATRQINAAIAQIYQEMVEMQDEIDCVA